MWMKQTGVKDLDVWSFFARVPGQRFPADRRKAIADFGPSSLGKRRYTLANVPEHKRARFRRWQTFAGRKVDLMMRDLPASTRTDPVLAIREWLEHGSQRGARRSSASHLAKKAVVMIDPIDRRGEVVWPAQLTDAMSNLAGPKVSIARAECNLVAKPGLYAIHAARHIWRELGLAPRTDSRPLYVGKAVVSLVQRDLRTHFPDEATIKERRPKSLTGWSTLRRSLAALLAGELGFRGTLRSPDQQNLFDKFGLSLRHDVQLSDWMRKQLRIATWIPADEVDLITLERQVIHIWNPPLNLAIPSPWKKQVLSARHVLKAQARAAYEKRRVATRARRT